MKPGNPLALRVGMVPIPADTVREMRGISIDALTPESSGTFFCLLLPLDVVVTGRTKGCLPPFYGRSKHSA